MDHVAIDLGGRESQICVRNATNDIVLEKRLATARLDEFFRTLPTSRVIVETCAEAFAVAAQAKDAGHDVRVVPATLVRSLGVGHRGIKTDARDARALSEASARVELASVHIPSELSREMKACAGMREVLVRCRTQLVNNVRGWLRGRLIRGLTASTANFPARLRAHFAQQGRELPPYLERQLDTIDGINEQIAAADAEIKQLAKDTEECCRLMTVPGVGPVTAVRFLAAVDEIGRFADAHRVQSYFGLTPGEASSSDTKHRTGLTKAGSSVVRWLMIQAAWSAYRTRPNDPMVLWAKAIAERKGQSNVAIVALARKLVGVLFALLRDKSTYNASRASTRRAEPSPPKAIVSGAKLVREARAGRASSPPSSARPAMRGRSETAAKAK